jgi:TolB-like protein/tetratricopeptide (TPR) repeat protein
LSLFAELKRRNVIRVILAYLAGAWLLIQIADTVFPAYGLPDSALPILITVLVIGLIPAVTVAWVFELTPQGLRRDTDIAPGESVAPQTGKRLDRIIIAVLALALSYFVFDEFVLERPVASDNSIAVLPFDDMSPGSDQAWFSDGIAEELLNLLAQVRELRVISRSSSFTYRGDDLHLPTITDALDVTYVLEGSVRQADGRIRITAQLIDARTDTHVWSETYDREMVDVFDIQDDIAGSIVDELKVRLLGAPPTADRTDPETYALFLQARHLVQVEMGDQLEAESLLLQALERDAAYLPASNMMVETIYYLTGASSVEKYTAAEGIALMREYADRALAIDPENSHANAHRGWMAFFYGGDLETAAKYLNRALEYDPRNRFALFAAGVLNRRIGHNDDAIAFQEAALAVDPLCSGCLYNLMNINMAAGRLDAAQAAAERRMRVAKGGWFTLGSIHLLKGDIRKALELFDKQKEDRIGWLAYRAIAFHELNEFDARDEALSELIQIEDSYAHFEAARVYAWTGNVDEAFERLERILDPENPDFTDVFSNFAWNPFFRNLWDDQRWLALREQAGLSAERLAAIELEMPD